MTVNPPLGQAGTEFMELQCSVQHYGWGDPDFIPSLVGIANPEGKPFAELWIGAHPDGPSNAILEKEIVPLNQLIESDPGHILHGAVAMRFGGQLPFLLKVLAAASPLSLQAHPSKAAAEEGFAREEASGLSCAAPTRNYRDRNHKPELIVALTDFYGLRGFRPLREIESAFKREPELAESGIGFEPQPESLRRIYSQFMTWPQQKVDGILRPLLARLADQHRREPFTRSDREYWILRADREYSRDGHHDRGLFSVYLLNLVILRPGEGMYLPAGILHAYLEGAGVEIMANSNNVLRGGWTPKHVDVPELLRNTTFEGGAPEIISGRRVEGTPEWIYPTPAQEFELSRVELDGQVPYRCESDHAVEIFVVVSIPPNSKVTLSANSGQAQFGCGAVFLVSAGAHYALTTDVRATLFKATVPSGAANSLGQW
jgi:mannose-6-phosphate isomerase class I